MQIHLNERELIDLSYTHKRIAVDEVESKMNYDEHQIAQRHEGDNNYEWRKALMDAGGVEEAARRAVLGEPEHPRFTVAKDEACRGRENLLRVMLDRGIMQVIAEGTPHGTPSSLESPYATEVRENRADGTC